MGFMNPKVMLPINIFSETTRGTILFPPSKVRPFMFLD